MGVLADVRVLTAPRHAHEYVVDEIKGCGAVDVPLQCGQHQQLPVLCVSDKEREIEISFEHMWNNVQYYILV